MIRRHACSSIFVGKKEPSDTQGRVAHRRGSRFSRPFSGLLRNKTHALARSFVLYKKSVLPQTCCDQHAGSKKKSPTERFQIGCARDQEPHLARRRNWLCVISSKCDITGARPHSPLLIWRRGACPSAFCPSLPWWHGVAGGFPAASPPRWVGVQGPDEKTSGRLRIVAYLDNAAASSARIGSDRGSTQEASQVESRYGFSGHTEKDGAVAA